MAKNNAAPLAQQMAETRKFFTAKNMPFILAGFFVSLGSVFGLGAAHVIERMRVGATAKEQKKVLANHFREQIASELGIRPEQVTYKHLEQASKSNPAFSQLIEKVRLEQERGERSAVMGTGAAMALGGFVPGFSAVSNAVGNAAAGVVGQAASSTVVHVGAMTAGSMASGIFNKDKLEVEDMLSLIDSKTAQGLPLGVTDVLLLRTAQDEVLQAEIKARFDKPLHQMDEVQQRAVFAALPSLYETATHDVQAVNSGRITSKDLLVFSPGAHRMQPTPQQSSQGSWAQRVGGPRAPQGSFVKAYQAEQPTTGATRSVR